MIRFLIHLAADKGARKIESGSPIGATIGAIAGAVAGVLTVFVLYQAEIIEGNWAWPAVSFGVGLALAGGFIGSLVRVRSKTVEPWNAKVTDSSTIRLTNYNHALAPVLVFLLLTGLILFAVGTAALHPEKARDEWLGKFDPRVLLFPVVYIASLVLAWRATLWIEVGPQIRIRRLFRTRTFAAQEISNWYFRSASGRMTRVPPPAGPTELMLLFGKGENVRVPILTRMTTPVAELLGRHIPPT